MSISRFDALFASLHFRTRVDGNVLCACAMRKSNFKELKKELWPPVVFSANSGRSMKIFSGEKQKISLQAIGFHTGILLFTQRLCF